MSARTAALLVGVLVLLGAAPKTPAHRVGVLIVADDGNSQWDAAIRRTVREANLDASTEIVLGPGRTRTELRRLRQAVERLEHRGIDRLVVIPLFVSTATPSYRQLKYMLKLSTIVAWPSVGEQLTLDVPAAMGMSLDEAPMLGDILVEYAQELSREPQHEALILLGEGAAHDTDDRQQQRALERLGEALQAKLTFHNVVIMTMRLEASRPAREQAEDNARQALRQMGAGVRVLVVPVLLAKGGEEREIPRLLAGLSYRASERMLVPHPKVSQWIAEEVVRLSSDEPEAVPVP